MIIFLFNNLYPRETKEVKMRKRKAFIDKFLAKQSNLFN